MLLLPEHSHGLCLNESCSNFLCAPIMCITASILALYLLNEQKPHIYSLIVEVKIELAGWRETGEGRCSLVHLGREVLSPTSFPSWL